MSIQLNTNIKIAAPTPFDKRYLSERTVNGSPLPYSATTEVISVIPISERYNGLSVLITIGGVNIEYWFKDGVADINLIEKKLNTVIPIGNFVTGGTNVGYFSGYTGIQTLPINSLVDNNYDGNYNSIYNYYYRGVNGYIHVGQSPIDNIYRRGYVKSTLPIKSWIWNEYSGNSNIRGWIFIDGDVQSKIGTFQAGTTYYNGTTSFPYTGNSWTTSSYYNNGSTVIINAVLGNTTTGSTITIGGRPFAAAQNNNLHFKTIVSKTPQYIGISDDETFIYLSGTTSIINGQNIGTGNQIFSQKTGSTLQFRTLVGSGTTSISQSGNNLIINSTGGGGNGTLTGATNGLSIINGGTTVALGGTLTGNTTFNGGILQYLTHPTFISNTQIIDKEYADTIASGLIPKEAVLVATSSNTALSGLTTIDGILLSDSDRVLVKNQSNPIDNGVYNAHNDSWTRASDFSGTTVLSSSYLWVMSGVTDNNTAWILSTKNPITIGVTELAFVMFNRATSVIGNNGITVNGSNIVSLGGTLTGNTTINTNGNALKFTGYLGSISSCIGNASSFNRTCVNTSNVILGTQNVVNCACINLAQSNNSICILTKGGNINLNSSASSGGGNVYITAPSGATYSACYHNNYTNRTVVDKEYVDNKLNSINVRYSFPQSSPDTFNLVPSDNFIGVTGYSAGHCLTIYLVDPPIVGQNITITDVQGQGLDYPITINAQSKTINGFVDNSSIINTDYGSISFMYNGYFWSATAFIN